MAKNQYIVCDNLATVNQASVKRPKFNEGMNV